MSYGTVAVVSAVHVVHVTSIHMDTRSGRNHAGCPRCPRVHVSRTYTGQPAHKCYDFDRSTKPFVRVHVDNVDTWTESCRVDKHKCCDSRTWLAGHDRTFTNSTAHDAFSLSWAHVRVVGGNGR